MLVTNKLLRVKRDTHNEIAMRTTYWLFGFIRVWRKHQKFTISEDYI